MAAVGMYLSSSALLLQKPPAVRMTARLAWMYFSFP